MDKSYQLSLFDNIYIFFYKALQHIYNQEHFPLYYTPLLRILQDNPSIYVNSGNISSLPDPTPTPASFLRRLPFTPSLEATLDRFPHLR